MLPVNFENHKIPPPQTLKNKASPIQDKINFFQTLNPFVQLLFAIGNAIFLPSFFVFNEFMKRLTPSQKVFSQTLKLPDDAVLEEVEPTKKDEGSISFEDQIAQLQERIYLLGQRFKQEHLIVEDMKEFEKLNVDISHALDELKPQRQTQKGKQDLPQEELARLKDLVQGLHDQMDDFCLREGDAILNLFHRILATFTKGGLDLPNDMREELLQTWKSLETAIRPHLAHLKPPAVSKTLSGKLAQLKKTMDGIKKKDTQNQTTGLEEPLKLRNITNSCYLDSVLQAFACIDTVCRDFGTPLSSDDYVNKHDEFEKKLAIQQEIVQFFKNRGTGLSKIGFVLSLLGGPSAYRLRDAIFNSGFEGDFTKQTLEDQHDAAILMDLLIDRFLPNVRFKTQIYTETKDFPGLEFHDKFIEPRNSLVVPLKPHPYQDLHSLVHWVMHKKIEREPNPKDQRIFDPKDGIVVDEKKGEKSKSEPAQKVAEYIQWQRFKELPQVLALRFQRSVSLVPNEPATKDDRPVDLPADGILDLTKYYDAPEKGPKQAKYKIKSYVAHSGRSVKFGHYVAYVEINGKYYKCDDLDAHSFTGIPKKDFYSRKDAYLLLLERLPEEEEVATDGVQEGS